MRSLSLLSISSHTLITTSPTPSSSSQSILTQISHNPTEEGLYAIAESQRPDGVVELQIFGLAHDGTKRGVIKIDTELVEGRSSVVSFKYLPESDTICILLTNGDIEIVYTPGTGTALRSVVTGFIVCCDKLTTSYVLPGQHEVVGSIDAGIQAAEWSPDEELLAIITGDDKLIAMTKDFEVLSEGPLRTADFGEDAPVNVGWGEKSTQFHGSVGKAAATATAATSTSSTSSSLPTSSSTDDGLPRISWRGDSAFFCVSSLDPNSSPTPTPTSTPSPETPKHRTIRIFSRIAALSSTSEFTPHLESSLAWQRSGSIIASTQKLPSSAAHHVVFYERNGLRRYEFDLREKGLEVRGLEWNSDSSLLGVWARREESNEEVVQIWYRNNYHWYLKHEISPTMLREKEKVTSVFWHPEKPLDLYISTTAGIDLYSLCWDVFASSRSAPDDDGSVAVVDGSTLKLTPFRHVNIPPPMSAIDLSLTSSRPSRTPVHVTFSSSTSTPSSTLFATLYSDGFLEVWDWKLPSTKKRGKGREEIVAPTLVWSTSVVEGRGGYALQCAMGASGVMGVLVETGRGRELVLVEKDVKEKRTTELRGKVMRLMVGAEAFLLEDEEGTILEVPFDAEDESLSLPSERFSSLPEFCEWIQPVLLDSSPPQQTIIGLSQTGRLYSGTKLLASNATSFVVTNDFLIFSTFSHEARFIPLFALEHDFAAIGEEGLVSHTEAISKSSGGTGAVEVKRALERGSRIVTVVPSSTNLILQMPRGNLETISPRPLVLQIVRQDIEHLRYRAAFLACRRHRIDLNILFDHAPDLFQSNLEKFVSQIKDIEYLNLYLSGLKNEDVTVTMHKPLREPTIKPKPIPNKINLICDLVRTDLEKRDTFHFANTVLTAYVRKSPPDYESALKTLIELKARDATRAEDAIKYIIFLSDANKLFDLALGMYDFSLVLMIAQHSQKDPREYLLFLRELRQLETFIQRYRIDDHLERHSSALLNLSKAGDEHFDAAIAYTKKHNLYSTALQAYKEDPARYKLVLVAYAEHLMDSKDYSQSGLLFSLGGQPVKAMEAYEKANAWQELFTLALGEGKRPASEIKALAVEVAERLKSKRRFTEAGQVLLEYGRDVDAAVAAHVEGSGFAEAIRLSSLYMRKDLVDIHVKPGILEVQARLLDEFSELEDQIATQSSRLVELRERRDTNPFIYFCLEDPTSAIDNVDLQPDGASDAGTAFTRYTAAAPTSFATTRQSSTTTRSKRRAVLKKAAGKKGTVFEETYLLQSITKTLEVKLGEYQEEVAPLLPILLSLNSSTHRTAATELQSALTSLETFLAAKVEDTWSWREAEWREELVEENSQRERGEFVQKPPPEDGTQKVLRPKMSKKKWKIGLLESEM